MIVVDDEARSKTAKEQHDPDAGAHQRSSHQSCTTTTTAAAAAIFFYSPADGPLLLLVLQVVASIKIFTETPITRGNKITPPPLLALVHVTGGRRQKCLKTAPKRLGALEGRWRSFVVQFLMGTKKFKNSPSPKTSMQTISLYGYSLPRGPDGRWHQPC